MGRAGVLAKTGLMALLALFALPCQAAEAAPADPDRVSPAAGYIASGLQLYEALEFPAALDRFQRAEQCSLSLEENVLIHSYKGMIAGNRGSPADAIPDFRVALSLNPHAELPEGTSPKLRTVWEQVRREVVARGDVPAASVPPPAEPPTSVEAAVLPRPSPWHAPTIPQVAIGAGGALATVVGVLVGVVAHQTGQLAVTDEFQDNASSDLHTANQQQTAAVVLIGVGVAGMAAAIALYVENSLASRSPVASPASVNSS